MKKGLKKLGAAFLALVMLLSCFAGVLTVSAQDPKTDDLKQTAQTAMTAFEDKITDGKAYVGMSKAYDAYVALNKALDQYYYGHYEDAPDDTAVNEAIEALNAAVAEMTEYEGYTVNLADGALDGSYTADNLFEGNNDGGTGDYVKDEMSNVIATYGVGSGAVTGENTANGQKTGTKYGAIVFLYDGENDMATPVNLYYIRTAWTGDKRTRYCYPTTDDFELRHRWHGESNTAEYQNRASDTGIGYEPGDQGHASSKNKTSNTYQSNTLYYTGTLTDDDYTRTIESIGWFFEQNNGNTASFTVSAPVYIINYNAISDKIDEVTPDVLATIKDVANYKQGGLKEIIDAFDKAISCNPNSYFDGISADDLADAGKTAVTDIEDIMAKLANLPEAQADVDYSDLRTAIDEAKDNYFEAWTEENGAANPENGLNAKYCAASWEAFKAAYEAACDLINNNYGDDAAEVTKALTEATLDEHIMGDVSKVVVPERDGYYDATCGNDGVGQRVSECPNCGENFIEEDNVTIPKNEDAHQYKGEVTNKPNCTTKGTTTYTCSVCGDTYDLDDIPTTDHKYNFDGEPDETKAPTCGEAGVKIYYCTECKGEPVEVAGDPATGKHTHADDAAGEVTKEATCVDKGVKTYTCAVCGQQYTEDIEIDPDNHIFDLDGDPDETRDATCGAPGAKIYNCQGCGKATKEVAGDPATGVHTHADDEAGEVTKEATCVDKGVKTYTCAVCGQQYTEDIEIDPDNHIFDLDGDPDETRDATCGAPGAKIYNCQGCGKATKEVAGDPATGKHTHADDEAGTVKKEATCVETGEIEYNCAVCGSVYTEETDIDPDNHVNPGAPKVETGDDGKEYDVVYCDDCGEELSRTLRDEHTTDPDESTTDPTDPEEPSADESTTEPSTGEPATEPSTDEPTTVAPSEESTTASAEESTTAAKADSNNKGTSPTTGADIVLPMFAATAIAGCFVLIAAKKKKAKDAE